MKIKELYENILAKEDLINLLNGKEKDYIELCYKTEEMFKRTYCVPIKDYHFIKKGWDIFVVLIIESKERNNIYINKLVISREIMTNSILVNIIL